jgi:hypothetical protein
MLQAIEASKANDSAVSGAKCPVLDGAQWHAETWLSQPGDNRAVERGNVGCCRRGVWSRRDCEGPRRWLELGHATLESTIARDGAGHGDHQQAGDPYCDCSNHGDEATAPRTDPPEGALAGDRGAAHEGSPALARRWW